MIKIKQISYSKVFSLGNYENEKIGIIAECTELEENSLGNEFEKIVEKVELIHKRNREKEISVRKKEERIYQLQEEISRLENNFPDDIPF